MYNLVIGLDISKTTLDGTLIRWGEEASAYDSFLNKKLGFEQLLEWKNTYEKKGDSVLICMEHTGHYAQRLVEFLKKKEIEFALINPLKIRRSMGLRRGKSDKADSNVIANYGMKFQEELSVNVCLLDEMLDLELLLAQRKRLQEKAKAFKQQIKYLNNCFTNDCAKGISKDLNKLIKIFNKELKKVESKIDNLITENEILKTNYELITSIPGVGRIIALYTLLHTQNFSKIKSPRKFACFCGIAPFKNESGTSIRKGTRVSHYANKRMKSLLNFGALSAVKSDPQLKVYYQKKVEEKKSKMLVLNSVRNKLVHRMYAVVKRGTPYVQLG